MNRKAYATDLTDAEWALLAPFIPPAEPGGRPRSTDMREGVNAIFYLPRGGCAWRLLPHEFPTWKTVYHYQRAWRRAGLWEHIHSVFRARLRVLAGRKAEPFACRRIALKSSGLIICATTYTSPPITGFIIPRPCAPVMMRY